MTVHARGEHLSNRELVRLFLLVWYESITLQKIIVPKLADTLDVRPDEIFYLWNMLPHSQSSERIQGTGIIQGTKWKFFFHGMYECDILHAEDGRFLQVMFGPNGRYDIFSGWGTLQFVMASKSPWSEFPQLKAYLAQEPPPYTYVSGEHGKMVELTKLIAQLGLFEVADKELYALSCELKEKDASRDKQGRYTLAFPPPYNNPFERMFWDLEVCEALVLSERGQQMFAQGLDAEIFSQLWEACMVEDMDKEGKEETFVNAT